MTHPSRLWRFLLAVAIGSLAGPATAAEPWYITGREVVREPMEVGEVVVLDGGELLVEDVGEPGFRLNGNLWALGSGRIVLRRSVIVFQSAYHGQYSLAALAGGTVEVDSCDYRVPNRVQHGIIAFVDGEVTLHDTAFGFVQLVAGDGGRITAERLGGEFEVIVMEPSSLVLRDIPRPGSDGRLWVWPTFPPGSEAVYTPPLPGFVDRWEFPPAGAAGIRQTVLMERCEASLWPLLVEDGARLTLRDIPEENWVVVGMILPSSLTIRGLVNGGPPVDRVLDLPDRSIALENASVDTWNLYPSDRALVRVEDSVVGEILVLDDASLVMERSTVDGSGGWFGATSGGYARVYDSTFTCDVQTSGDSTLELHRCTVLPYPQDPDGVFTRIGAWGRSRILLDGTGVASNPALGDSGVLAVTWLADPPPHPPAPGDSVTLHGVAAVYSADPEVAGGSWRLEALPRWTRTPVTLGSGTGVVDPAGDLGTWSDADPYRDHELRIVLTDGLGRVLSGSVTVPAAERPAPAVRSPSGRPVPASGR